MFNQSNKILSLIVNIVNIAEITLYEEISVSLIVVTEL